MKLQELNGAKVGTLHKSEKSCAEIIGHIAQHMRMKLVSNIKEIQSKISITIDSTVHRSTYIIIDIWCDVSGKADVDNAFLDITELTKGTDAKSIDNSLRQNLRQEGLDDEFLGNNLFSITTDGAAVLTGKTTGLIAKLKRDFSNIHSIHCLVQHLELAFHHSSFVSPSCTLCITSPQRTPDCSRKRLQISICKF